MVIPTFGGGRELGDLIKNVYGQGRPPGCTIRVVVVENGTQNCGETATSEGATYIHVARANASNARNVGAESEASPDVLVFVDDDVIPREGWLAALISPLAEGAAQAVVGAVVVNTEEPVSANIRRRFVDTATAMNPEAPFLAGLNMAVQANVFRDLGGFDDRLGPGTRASGGEDVLLGMALTRSGGHIAWAPEAIVEHVVPASRLTQAALLRRAAAEGRADAWIIHHWHQSSPAWLIIRVIRSALWKLGADLDPRGGHQERQLVANTRLSRDRDLLCYQHPILGIGDGVERY
ncbi:glycosyltransferase family 2 protein [Rhodococcus antarcticus]|uniref:Glycosyltransferase family 2 protein n=1 Tax=Rhodococcus antarcticus TaxID=2987751 RepID=A0ABY6P6M2_9NOCA|nr:glycosyltransferase [Rhodococcus antarcticus]UZJ26753.1 glycosyltransferase family 2 protein [Rhodococcus antarcticus]